MNNKICLTMVLAGLIPCMPCAAQPIIILPQLPASYATNYPEDFILTSNGKSIWNTNTDRFWRRGVWKEDTNGWRVLLTVRTNPSDPSLVEVGSTTINSGPGYLRTPYGKFAKFELLDSAGKIVKPKPDAGTNMLKWYNHDLAYDTNQPAWASPTNGSLEVDFPETTTVKVFPHFGNDAVGDFSFSTKTGPMLIISFKLGDLYSITNEGDYTLTVQPVLYKYDPRKNINGTNNTNVLHRVDLPSVTAKVHLKPSQ